MRYRGPSVTDPTVHEMPGFASAARLLALLLGVVLVAGTTDLHAQHGGGRGTQSRPFICVHDCPDPTERNELIKNDLDKFDHLIAVQATAEQSVAFGQIQQVVQAASTQVKTFRQLLEKSPTARLQPDSAATLYRFLEKVRTDNQTFLASFSNAQKSGMQDLIRKMANANSDLGKEVTTLNEMLQASQPSANIPSVLGSVDKALSGFQSEQMALAREMNIIPSEGQDLTFHLPQVTTSAEIAGRQVSIPVAGEAVRSAVTDGRSLFDFRVVADLSDLQDNATDIFRSQLTSTSRCGQRIEVKQAMLLPQSAGSVAELHLHHERWICPSGAEPGGGGELLLAAGDATVEIKLVPSADPNGDLHLAAEVGHVDADEVFRDSLLTGPLGAKLAGQISNLVLPIMKTGADLGAILPPAAHQSVSIEKAQFQANDAGQLRLVLDGQLRFSEEQIKEFAAQLKQQLSAQETSSQ